MLPTGAEFFTAAATDAAGTSQQSLKTNYLPGRSEQLQKQLSSDHAAFVFDAPTLGYAPNRYQQGASFFVTEGSQSGVLALLGHYMASSFTTKSDHNGGSIVIAEANAGNPSLLSSPHHT